MLGAQYVGDIQHYSKSLLLCLRVCDPMRGYERILLFFLPALTAVPATSVTPGLAA